MIIVMGVMAASSLFVAAAFAAANGDLPLTRDSQDRKQAYSAAEAGINYYQYHLNQDPDYWTRCTNVPRAERDREPAGQPGVERHRAHDDPRRWRKVAGTTDSVHARADAGHRLLDLRREQLRDDDRPGDGHVQGPRDRPSAREQQAQAQPRRVVPPPLVPRLPLLHRLRDDRPDQLLEQQPGVGAGQLRRHSTARSATTAAPEIQFADADAINGPFHTNDDILTCGTPTFGRNSADSIEFSPVRPTPGFTKVGGSCPRGDPVFNGPRRAGVKSLTMPPTNSTLQTVATSRRPRLHRQDHDPLQRPREQHDGHERRS